MTQNKRPVRRAPGDSRFGALDGERPVRGNRPQPSGRAPSAGRAAKGPGALPGGFWPLVGVCALIIALGLVLQGLMPDGFVLSGVKDRAERPVAAQVSEIHGEGPIRLNELMTANGGEHSGRDKDCSHDKNGCHNECCQSLGCLFPCRFQYGFFHDALPRVYSTPKRKRFCVKSVCS